MPEAFTGLKTQPYFSCTYTDMSDMLLPFYLFATFAEILM